MVGVVERGPEGEVRSVTPLESFDLNESNDDSRDEGSNYDELQSRVDDARQQEANDVEREGDPVQILNQLDDVSTST